MNIFLFELSKATPGTAKSSIPGIVFVVNIGVKQKNLPYNTEYALSTLTKFLHTRRNILRRAANTGFRSRSFSPSMTVTISTGEA